MLKYDFYLSGPMTGYINYNFDTFHKVAKTLREQGFLVYSPAESFDGDQTLEWPTYMKHDYKQIKHCSGVILLPGWEKSIGSVMEAAYAASRGQYVYGFNMLDNTFQDLYYNPHQSINSRELTEYIVQQYKPQKNEPKSETLAIGENVISNDWHIKNYEDLFEDFTNDEYYSILSEADHLVSNDRGTSYGHPLDDFTKSALIATAVLYNKLKPGEQVVAEDIPLIMQGVKISRETNVHKRDNLVDGAGYWKTLDMVISERARRNAMKNHPSRG